MIGLWVSLAVFFGVAALIVLLTARQRNIWKRRPAALRALASRRGFQFVENPGAPDDLLPLRPIERKGTIRSVELPAAVRGRTLDTQLTLLDLFTMVESGPGRSHRDLLPHYDTFISFQSPAIRWPHFEFAEVGHIKPDSLTGSLMTMVANATESIAAQRGLKHVPIPEDPGCQLYVGDTTNAVVARDTLMKFFATREGWWVGAKDGVMTLQKVAQRKSGSMHNFVRDEDLDRFVDEAIEI